MTFEASRRKQVLVLQPKGKALYDGKLLAAFNLIKLSTI
jgi:hypothetical protein